MNKDKFFLYARKSQESEERQIQSIDDQIRVMKQRAIQMWIDIIEIFQESMSAKAPWRYKFNEMIHRIQQWEANGIIAWKLDRLSRNPVDSGTIQYMLQNWELKSVVTNDREYRESEAGLLMSVENGMSNQFIIDLKKNVKRWMDSKYLKGVRPTRAPIWYINTTHLWDKVIVKDDERFLLVRKIWDLMLTGNYTTPQIQKIVNEELGLTTRRTKTRGGTPLGLNTVYRVLWNIFYTWHFYFNGELVKWVHEPMITLDEYDRVQMLLWKTSHPRPKSYEFAFTGLIRCWECGWSVTAEIKRKKIVSTWEIKQYTYYHCSKRKKGVQCNQKTIRRSELERQILEVLSQIEIIPEFKQWAINVLRDDYENQVNYKIQQSKSIEKAILSEEKKLKKLTDILISELISDEDFKNKRNQIEKNILKLKEQRDTIDMRSKKVLDDTIYTFKFASEAKEKFKWWDLHVQKEILSTLGQNLILKDRKIAIELHPWFQVLADRQSDIRGGLKRLEPSKNSTSNMNTSTIYNKNSAWFGM